MSYVAIAESKLFTATLTVLTILQTWQNTAYFLIQTQRAFLFSQLKPKVHFYYLLQLRKQKHISSCY